MSGDLDVRQACAVLRRYGFAGVPPDEIDAFVQAADRARYKDFNCRELGTVSLRPCPLCGTHDLEVHWDGGFTDDWDGRGRYSAWVRIECTNGLCPGVSVGSDYDVGRLDATDWPQDYVKAVQDRWNGVVRNGAAP